MKDSTHPGIKARRVMRISERHVAAVTRPMPDPGPLLLQGFRPATESDYEEWVHQTMASAPTGGFWVFAYGSLIWNPDFDHVEQRIAQAHGWRRIFCLGWDYRFRGNSEQPGLMLALDRGGSCRGVAFRLPDKALAANLGRLIRREMSMVPSAFPARWITVVTPDGPLKALTDGLTGTLTGVLTGGSPPPPSPTSTPGTTPTAPTAPVTEVVQGVTEILQGVLDPITGTLLPPR